MIRRLDRATLFLICSGICGTDASPISREEVTHGR